MNWRYSLNLNGVLSKMSEKHDLTRVEEPCPQEVKDAICAELSKKPVAHVFDFLVERIKEAGSIAAVNRALDRVYDLADEKRIWMGM